MATKFPGLNWYKCDLHLHTPASKCFADQTVTPEQWVERCIEQGLDCVAVTDHNTGAWIDKIIQAAGDRLTVFPGVEITCDSSKVHLLVLFDLDKDKSYVEDFLLLAEISRELFGTQEAYSSKTVLQIIQLATQKGGIVIPAHVDQYNGLSEINNNNTLKDILCNPDILGFQVVHKEFKNVSSLSEEIITQTVKHYKAIPDGILDYNEYLSQSQIQHKDRIAITELVSNIREWSKCFKKVVETQKALLSFSDNPDGPLSPKHGLLGIGSSHTFIKMDATITLESLRQAMLMHENRIISEIAGDKDAMSIPYSFIESISITGSKLNKGSDPFKVHFNPGLNTIIGGRGSGKSSIVKFIRAVTNSNDNIHKLQEIEQDYDRFIGNGNSGVVKPETQVQIVFISDNVKYRVSYNSHGSLRNKTPDKIEYFEDNEFKIANSVSINQVFDLEIFNQKQIYKSAQDLNSIRDRIDHSNPEITSLKNRIDSLRTTYQALIGKREELLILSDQQKKQLGIRESLEIRISSASKSNLSLLDGQYQVTESHTIKLGQTLSKYKKIIEDLISLVKSGLELADLDHSSSTSFDPNINSLFGLYSDNFKSVLNNILEEIQGGLLGAHSAFVDNVKSSQWYLNRESLKRSLDIEASNLTTSELEDYRKLGQLRDELAEVLKQIEKLKSSIVELGSVNAEMERIYNEILSERDNLFLKRQAYLNSIGGDQLQISVAKAAEPKEYVKKLRQIINRPTGFEDDFDKIEELIQSSKFTIIDLHNKFLQAREDESSFFKGHFRNVLGGLNSSQFGLLMTLIPEDKVLIKFKNKNSFTDLSVGSAGQQSASVLSLILGDPRNTPIILDQPEDDLDNKLVHGLIVNSLKRIKHKKQLIVVTHNANIPVNADADNVLILESSKKMQLASMGSVDKKEVTGHICDIMEGSIEAFNLRSNRYKQLKNG